MGYVRIGALRREVTAAVGWPTHVVFQSALQSDVWDEIQGDLTPLF